MIEGFIKVNPDGTFHVPKEISSKLGLSSGDTIPFEMSENALLLHRSLEKLNRVYIEITNFCNLNCKTCIRNVWDEKTGFMKMGMFRSILDNLSLLPHKPEIFIGGFGEPTTHPDIIPFIHEVKTADMPFHMITNGTKLSKDLIQKFIDEQIDYIWISVDSVCEEAYEHIREGASFSSVNANIKRLDEMKVEQGSDLPRLGIAYVAMKETLNQLPDIVTFAMQVHADKLMMTNVLAHTDDLAIQRLYEEAMHENGYSRLEVMMPRLDLKNPVVATAVSETCKIVQKNILDGFNSLRYDCCPFVLKGSMSIRWDGQVSPCLPLLHTSPSYLGEVWRLNEAHSVGSLLEDKPLDIWNSDKYFALRKKLKEFNFSSCTLCYHKSCDRVKSNQADCFGNLAPACGGCLWAQGFIQCP